MIGYAPSNSPRFGVRDLKLSRVEAVAGFGRWERLNFRSARQVSLAPFFRPRSRSKRCRLIYGDLSIYV